MNFHARVIGFAFGFAALLTSGAHMAVAQSAPKQVIQAADVDYASGTADLQGYLAFDSSKACPSPAILIVPDWMGVSDYDKEKARELASKGYVSFVADVYGRDSRPKNTKEAGEMAGKYKSSRALLRERMRAALSTMSLVPQVDTKRVVVMGYCFGGMAALELERSGAPVAATVSFHGTLSSPTPADARNIKTPILVLHGADDPFVPRAEVEAFEKEMKEAGVSMTFVEYPGAVHAFTHPSAGNDNSKGAAYNATADKQSWTEFLRFIDAALKD